jgi:hypothetical protein
MIAADHHSFVKSRTQYAKCACGWTGKPTADKNKSWKAHVRRSSY